MTRPHWLDDARKLTAFFELEPYVQVAVHANYQRGAASPRQDTIIVAVDLKLKSRVRYLIETIRRYNQNKVLRHDLWWAEWDFVNTQQVTRIGVISPMSDEQFEFLTSTISALCAERDLMNTTVLE